MIHPTAKVSEQVNRKCPPRNPLHLLYPLNSLKFSCLDADHGYSRQVCSYTVCRTAKMSEWAKCMIGCVSNSWASCSLCRIDCRGQFKVKSVHKMSINVLLIVTCYLFADFVSSSLQSWCLGRSVGNIWRRRHHRWENCRMLNLIHKLTVTSCQLL